MSVEEYIRSIVNTHPNYKEILENSEYLGKMEQLERMFYNPDPHYWFKMNLVLSCTYKVYFTIHEFRNNLKLLLVCFDTDGSYIKFPDSLEVTIYFEDKEIKTTTLNNNVNENMFFEVLKSDMCTELSVR